MVGPEASQDKGDKHRVIILKRVLGALMFIVFGAAFAWPLLFPKNAHEIGFGIGGPSYLFGCYAYNGAIIRLGEDYIDFNGARVSASYGMRKQLREVVYPSQFPWLDTAEDRFRFKNDRFELLDLQEADNGEWSLEIWLDHYLDTGDPDDLVSVEFEKTDCPLQE